jgi:hypothetical protein
LNKGVGRTAVDPAQWATEVFVRVDLNRDGRLSEEEFINAARHEPNIMGTLQHITPQK